MVVYYVDPVGGDDSNAGTAYNNAWATLGKALSTGGATGLGDQVRCMATGDFEPTGVTTIDDSNSSTVLVPTKVLAADASGNLMVGAGKFTISGASLPATTNLFTHKTNPWHIQWQDIRITGATAHNISVSSGAEASAWGFVRSRIDSAGNIGVVRSTDTPSPTWTFLDTDIDSCAQIGYYGNAPGTGACVFIGGSLHSNGGSNGRAGADAASGGCVFIGMRNYGGGEDGLKSSSTGSNSKWVILDNTFHDMVDECIFAHRVGEIHAIGNSMSLSDNGVYWPTVPTGAQSFRHNHYHDMTAWEWANGPGGASDEHGKQNGDPMFADAAGGDFQPKRGSPLIRNGPSGRDIGAIASATGGPRIWF